MGTKSGGVFFFFFIERVTGGFGGGDGRLVGGVDPGRTLGFQHRPESALLVGNGEKAFSFGRVTRLLLSALTTLFTCAGRVTTLKDQRSDLPEALRLPPG